MTGNPRWAPEFSAAQLGFYVQDKWDVTDSFQLTYGLRMDMPLFFDTPVENAKFNEWAAGKGYDLKTNRKLASTPMWTSSSLRPCVLTLVLISISWVSTGLLRVSSARV